MLSRRLISAVAALLVAFHARSAWAQAQNLEAGKTPSQLFAQTCSLCHKSSRGLLKTVPPGSLPAFLRQHYTTSTDMAGTLSAYLLSNGATDTRLGGDNLTKQGKEARAGTGPDAKPAPAASKPSDGGLFGGLFDSKPSEPKPAPSTESKPEQKPKPERRTREAGRPDVDDLENIPPGTKPPQGAEAAPSEGEQKGRKPSLDKRKPGAATAKQEPKAEPAAPAETAKVEPQTRPDPVPGVTPAPGALEAPAKTAEQRSSNLPVFNLEPQPPQAEAAPPSPPRPPAGPPVVPISQ